MYMFSTIHAIHYAWYTLVESPHQHYSHRNTHEHDVLCEARREQWCYSHSQYLSSYSNIGYSVVECSSVAEITVASGQYRQEGLVWLEGLKFMYIKATY